jgi:hypothetical protein
MITIKNLEQTEELNQATRRNVFGGYYLTNNSSLPAPGGPVPIPYPNTGLANNTRQLTKEAKLVTEVTYDPMQPMASYW